MNLPNIPVDVKASMQRYLRDLSQVMQREFGRRVPNTEEVSELLLVSPGRKVYSVQVADDGTLSTTLVRE